MISVSHSGSPPDRYIVTYSCKGLFWLPGYSAPSVSTFHQMSVYLHRDYPRLPPLLKWMTPIFHPNILSPDKNGGVCIGAWTPAESLSELCIRIGEMIQYKHCRVDDALDLLAADWARRNKHMLPVDDRALEQVADGRRLCIEMEGTVTG